MAKDSKSKALNFRINSEKVDIVIRPQQQHQHVCPLGVSVHGAQLKQILFFLFFLLWARVVGRHGPLCGSCSSRPWQWSEHNLTNWDQVRGILSPSFILYIREKPGLQGWLTEPKTKSSTIHNNNTGVFTTRINKNTWLRLVTPTGKVTERENTAVYFLLESKVCKHKQCVHT